MHINPNGAGTILIGANRSTGGFTALEIGISAQTAGYSFLQSTRSSGTSYGSLALNPSGGNIGAGTNLPLARFHIKQTSENYPVADGGLRLGKAYQYFSLGYWHQLCQLPGFCF